MVVVGKQCSNLDVQQPRVELLLTRPHPNRVDEDTKYGWTRFCDAWGIGSYNLSNGTFKCTSVSVVGSKESSHTGYCRAVFLSHKAHCVVNALIDRERRDRAVFTVLNPLKGDRSIKHTYGPK